MRRARLRTGIAMAAAAVLASAALAGCSFGDGGVKIGATNFTESRVLANMYMLVLENAGIDSTVMELSGREIVEPALEKNQLQVMPDYLATLTTYLNAKVNGPDSTSPASQNIEQTYVAGEALAGPLGIKILPPSPAADTNAFAVTPAYAQANNLQTLSQLGTFSQTNPVVLGAGPDCPTRPYCQPGLEQTYGIKFAGFKALDTGGPLTVQALQQDVIQLGLVFSSSGLVAANNLVLLADDKHLQPADNVVPVVNDVTLAQFPQIPGLLNAVSEKLRTEDLQYLNAEVDIERQDPRTVAQNWLMSVGLLPGGTASPSPSPS